MQNKHFQLLILGSGPAGCTAAIYSALANLNVALITGNELGGQITKSSNIINWPGELNGISGYDLMNNMLNQVKRTNTPILSDNIIEVTLSKYPFKLYGNNYSYSCDALIIATGSSPRLLGLTAEEKFIGKGISTCAICDGYFYKHKNVVIIGGGNTAAEDALYLSKIAANVTIVYRNSTMKADINLMHQLEKIKNIKFEPNCIVNNILGNNLGITGIEINDISNNVMKFVDTHGIFVAIGNNPNTAIFNNQLNLECGYITVDKTNSTNISGIYAAGDVIFDSIHQAIVAASSGCMAALKVKKFLSIIK